MDRLMANPLDELLQQFILDSAQTPPPASATVINSIPSVKISDADLRHISDCSICREEFEVNAQASALPCNHIYHPDCIALWLSIQNSCPLCRCQLSVPSDDRSLDGDADEPETSDPQTQDPVASPWDPWDYFLQSNQDGSGIQPLQRALPLPDDYLSVLDIVMADCLGDNIGELDHSDESHVHMATV